MIEVGDPTRDVVGEPWGDPVLLTDFGCLWPSAAEWLSFTWLSQAIPLRRLQLRTERNSFCLSFLAVWPHIAGGLPRL